MASPRCELGIITIRYRGLRCPARRTLHSPFVGREIAPVCSARCWPGGRGRRDAGQALRLPWAIARWAGLYAAARSEGNSRKRAQASGCAAFQGGLNSADWLTFGCYQQNLIVKPGDNELNHRGKRGTEQLKGQFLDSLQLNDACALPAAAPR